MLFSATDDLVLAHALADIADPIAMRYFRQPDVRSRAKPDGSPVTEADLLIEAAIRDHLLRYRPDDTVTGEESGSHGDGRRRWFIDPIDGTTAFLAGRPDWRTLIAVEDAGTITTGLVSSPALGGRWWATRGGAAWTRPSGDVPGSGDRPSRITVTATAMLGQATVALWPPAANLPEPLRAPVARLMAHPSQGRAPDGSGIRYGPLLVALGQLDAFLFAGAAPWDIAAMVAIVEEAGGRFTDLTGGRALDTAMAVFSNGRLHDQILGCLHAAG